MTYQPPPRRDAGDVVEPESAGAVYPSVRTIPPAHWRAIQVIWFLAGLIDVLVGLRFLLKLFGASAASPFVTLLYSITAPLVAPFAGIFPTAGTTTFVFEPAASWRSSSIH